MTVAGYIEKFATIIPHRVVLSGIAGQELKKEVRIIPEEKYPFKIVNVNPKNSSHISVELKEIKESKKVEYLLTIQNLKKEKGRYHETIKLKTDSKVKPEIHLNVYGNIRGKLQKENK